MTSLFQLVGWLKSSWNFANQVPRDVFARSAGSCSRRKYIPDPQVPAVEVLESRTFLSAVSVVLDYRFDTNNFFDSQLKKDIIQEAANVFAAKFKDDLTAISPSSSNRWTAVFSNPATGATESVANLAIASSTIVVFVGGRDLPGQTAGLGGPGGYSVSGTTTFRNTVANRGQSGATASPPTDFGPWGGAITFDSDGTDWFFGTTTEGLGSNQTDFYTVALHEIGHVFGFGTSNSFDALVSGGEFRGPKSIAAYDGTGNPPLSEDLAHWQDGVTDEGMLTAMDPVAENGVRVSLTDFDWAAFDDLGWSLNSGLPTVTPTIGLSTTSTVYNRKGTPTFLDPTAIFTNPDEVPLGTGVLIVSVFSNRNKNDRISIGTGNGITKSGATLKFNGITVGTYSNSTASRDFKLTLKPGVTDAALQAILRNLNFKTATKKAPVGERFISIQLNNVPDQTIGPVTKVVSVI